MSGERDRTILFLSRAQTGPVSQVVPIGASYPVLACLLGVLILGETMTVARVAGVACVMVGTYLLR